MEGQTYGAVDKGWAIELDLFAESIINGTPPPNDVVKAARASVIAYKVNESIATGKPVAITESEYIF